jgi:hypothetical protein
MFPGSQIGFSGSWAPDAPSDMIAALGKNGQFINVVPSQRLIMVRMGEAPDSSFDVPLELNNGIWQKLNGVICNQTSVNNKNITPTQFMLNQNYPNPFNPGTTISFNLPSRLIVSLKVFDALGREIGTLVNDELSAGDHMFRWNAKDFASGVYFYRLQTGSFIVTKKLILLR